MAVTLSILGSGSAGNAAVVATARTRILLDCGFSRRETMRRMRLAGHEPESLAAILITHEHSDHVAGLGRMAASILAPVFLNQGTRSALGRTGDGLERCEVFATGHRFTIGDIEVTAFSIPHDAAEPVAYSFVAEGVRIVFLTDVGYLAAHVREHLRRADCAVIESNHDLEMLKAGGYPWALKQRVMGRLGHLSNDGLAEYLATDYDGAASHLVLAHLSENNNLPSLARLSAERALAPRASRPQVHVAPQDEPLAAIRF